MNKQEILAVIGLFFLLLAWGFLQREKAQKADAEAPDPQHVAAATAVPEAADVEEPAPALSSPEQKQTNDVQAAVSLEDAEPVPQHAAAEEHVTLSNKLAAITFSSWGGGIVSSQLAEYRQTLEPESGPITLDFHQAPSLSYIKIPGLSTRNDFTLTETASDRLVITRQTESGLRLTRTVEIGEGYQVSVKDRIENIGPTAVKIPEHNICLGPMEVIRTKAKTRGLSYLGLDTCALDGGEGVEHWGNKLGSFFGASSSRMSCRKPTTEGIPENISHPVGMPVLWGAVKNKFFVQILQPESGAQDCVLNARRSTDSQHLVIETLSAEMIFPEKIVDPGESVTREMKYYVGPKKYKILRGLGEHLDEIMQFGFLKPLCKIVLLTLNVIYKILPNYGVAIILLTVLVRLIFWPVMQKSTDSMKKMQKIQPLVSEIRKKYKDNPQKMNQEVMVLYKENKVNPMAGCLPIVVQIPVFIALFTVLRSAVELRFAGFLWVKDLSEPEGLLANVLPIPLNILPLFMTGTMIWQQHLTPTAGDPQQRKMMMIMPAVFLFIMYSMPAALVLYWSVSQCMSIGQLLLQQRKAAEEEQSSGPNGSSAPAQVPPRKRGKRS